MLNHHEDKSATHPTVCTCGATPRKQGPFTLTELLAQAVVPQPSPIDPQLAAANLAVTEARAAYDAVASQWEQAILDHRAARTRSDRARDQAAHDEYRGGDPAPALQDQATAMREAVAAAGRERDLLAQRDAAWELVVAAQDRAGAVSRAHFIRSAAVRRA